MQPYAGERSVDTVTTQVGKMLKRVSLDDERPDEQTARQKEKCRAGELEDLPSRLRCETHIRSEREMDQRGEENIDMSRPHQNAKLLRDRVLVRKVGAHVAARRRKDEEQDDADDEMDPIHEHRDCRTVRRNLHCSSVLKSREIGRTDLMKKRLGILLVGLATMMILATTASSQASLVKSGVVNPKPANLDLEEGNVGDVPSGWISPTKSVGYVGEISESNPKTGKRAAVLRSLPDATIAPRSFGNIMQAIDATAYRGHLVRFRAAARIVSADDNPRAQLWMRVDRPGGLRGFFDNMQDRPIRSDKWSYYDIVGVVDADAENLSVGMIFIGKGSAWLDDVSITDLGKPVTTIDPARPLTKQKLENVVAFTKLLGYVRHFYPGDEAFGANWNAIAIDGMRVIENPDGPAALARALEEIFKPVAPNVRVFPTGSKPDLLTTPANYRDLKLAWYRHTGFGQGKADSPYATDRPIKKVAELPDKDDGAKLQRAFHADLGGGVSCVVPLAVFADETGTLPHGTYKRDRDRELLVIYTGDDRATRLADVALSWNIFEHFFPYFDVVKVDWPAELRATLLAAATDKDELAFLPTLRLMVAKLQDGHGGVYDPREAAQSLLPVIFRWIDGKVVIVNSATNIPNGPKPGDVVLKIDGTPAEDVVAHIERYISGATPQWKRYRAMERLRAGAKDSTTTFEISTGSEKPRTVIIKHDDNSQSLSESRPPMIDEIRPSIFYVDLDRVADSDFNTALPKLAAAKGVIFDLRGYPRVSPVVIQHLIDKPVQSARWNVPIITEPDRTGTIEYATDGRWDLQPEGPRLTGKIAFITDGRAISYAESYMGIIEAYKLAAIVGETTAGTNGNINPFTLPGGYTVVWTGMKVLKHDGSRHHGVGIKPTIPVLQTIAGIASGKDEQLEAAIKVVSQ